MEGSEGIGNKLIRLLPFSVA